ncbi:MAG: beta-lactamase family protein [Chitinophagaceae bacterium]|jgi:CubicO group peptidase (beta-lactamase class C family)|nr:beta-lactamase family protein [Chitinophagaceae bacterium]
MISTRFLILFTLLSVSLYAQPGQLQQRIQLVENSLMPYVPVNGFAGWNLAERMRYYGVPGLSIAVIHRYKIDWAKGYGWADSSRRIPVDTQTMFSAGSISKLVMAAAALQLAEQGSIGLDSPINRYLRSWQLPENELTRQTPVTLRMLLSHTAGTSQTSYFGFSPDKHPLPDILAVLRGDSIAETRGVVVNSAPKKEFRYSGGGSMVAQLALMDVTRQPFAQLTDQRVFKPLGMQHSTFEQPLPPALQQHAAWAYSQASWFMGMPYVYPQQAAAGLYSTPADLARFFIDLQLSVKGKGQLLQRSTALQMMTRQVAVSNGTYREEMGIGPFLIQRSDNTDSSGLYFEFTGVNAGFLAYGIASVHGGNGVIVMLNSGDDQNGIGKEIRRAVASVYHWPHFLPDAVQPVRLPAATLDSMAGRYRMGPNEVLYLRRENDYLVERINNGRDIYCFPISADTLVLTDFNVKAFFQRNAQGSISGLQTVWQNQPMPKMGPQEFSANEYLEQGNTEAALQAFGALRLNEYQLTYMAYEALKKKPADYMAARILLQVAEQQHPASAIVQARWGDYHHQQGQKAAAIERYQKALQLDPGDTTVKKTLAALLAQ